MMSPDHKFTLEEALLERTKVFAERDRALYSANKRLMDVREYIHTTYRTIKQRRESGKKCGKNGAVANPTVSLSLSLSPSRRCTVADPSGVGCAGATSPPDRTSSSTR